MVKSGFGGGLEMQNPHHEKLDGNGDVQPSRVGGMMPKYHLVDGLSNRKMRSWIESALPLAGQLEELLPESVRQRHRLLEVVEAVRRGQHPETEEDYREARRRMAFAELFELQAAFALMRAKIAAEPATPIAYKQDVIEAFKSGLGFELTQAQRKATQPYGVRSLGSVFKNPPGDTAGRLIEAAGLKGRRAGGAEISRKHANFIVNVERASAADVLALTSTYEGFPNVLLEGMAAGAVPVATSVGGCRELVTNGETGLLAPPRAPAAVAVAVARVLGDPALARRLATAARRRVEGAFSVEVMARRTMDAYLRLLHAAHGPATVAAA